MYLYDFVCICMWWYYGKTVTTAPMENIWSCEKHKKTAKQWYTNQSISIAPQVLPPGMANPVGAKKPVRESCIPERRSDFLGVFLGGESHPIFFDTETMLLGDLHGFTHSWDYWDHLGVEKKIWPSGNLWHFANGTMAQFEIVDVAVKMVILHMNHHFPMVFPWFSHGFPIASRGYWGWDYLKQAMDPMVAGCWINIAATPPLDR